MLVLSRKKDETIILKGPNMEDIKITVVRIDNRNKVRIGIEADKEITVLRSELDSELDLEIIFEQNELTTEGIEKIEHLSVGGD